MSSPAPGTVVAWWEHDAIVFGVLVAEEKQRIVLVGTDAKEQRLAATRVVASLASMPAPPRTPEGRKDAAAAASAMAGEIAACSASVDVPTLWELTKDDGRPLDEAHLADLALSRGDAAARLATMIALTKDGVRFVRKAAGWQPRAEDAVRAIVEERKHVARRADETSAAFAALAAAWRGAPYRATGTASERRILEALESLAVLDIEAGEKERGLAADALEAAGARADRPSEAAFHLLRRTGRFTDDDENLAIVRYGLRAEFSEETLRAAEAAARTGFDRATREDFTGAVTVTIDDEATREIDDALSIGGTAEGGARIGIHIADPCAFIAEGDAVDAAALSRGTTYYFPERKLLMIPPVLSENAASLVAGADRPALSFLVDVLPDGRVGRLDIRRSIVRVDARLSYDEVDATLGRGAGPYHETLSRLSELAAKREALRRTAGAITLRAPEAEIRVDGDSMTLKRRDPDTPAQRLVAEAMVLAGEVAAAWLDEHRLSAIYRKQAPPDGPIPAADPRLPSAVHVRAVRRALKRGEAGPYPGPHHALGLAAYAQVTSPLRRYQDLALHRQIVSGLAGGPPAYDPAAMLAVQAATERAEYDGRRAERAMDRYWMLRYLGAATGKTVTGVVVDTLPRPFVVLDETLVEVAVPSLSGASIGDRVRLQIARVNPRADLLVLRPA